MSARTLNKLSAKKCEAARKGGEYADGGGLILLVDEAGNRRWVMRVSIAGKRVKRGLGPFPEVSLGEARDRAAEIRRAAKEGRDPTADQRIEAVRTSSGQTTLREGFETFWSLKEKGLSNGKHRWQWANSLERYVFPGLGDLPVEQITPDHVIRCLAPIWSTKHVTATRCLQRLRLVVESHAIRAHSSHSLPWQGILKELNASVSKHAIVVEHHRALPWQDVPALWRLLCEKPTASRLALRWVMVTACRSGEARGATWAEIDRDAAVWTIPAARMKARREHRVPLSTAALALLDEVRELNLGSRDGLVFPAPNSGKVLSDMSMTKLLRDLKLDASTTVHGLRSSFKDWAAHHGVDDRVSESQLAHADPNAVRAAYLRSDFLDQRREVMGRWSGFITKS